MYNNNECFDLDFIRDLNRLVTFIIIIIII